MTNKKSNKNIQLIRLCDVFLIGPYLIYLVYKGKISKTDKYILFALGTSTILYNGINFLRQKK